MSSPRRIDPSKTDLVLNDIIPAPIRKAADELPPDLIGIDQHTLEALLKKRHARLTPADHQLRIMFWREYEFAQNNHREMNQSHIYGGVCHKSNWDRVLKVPEKMAWILCPPANYMVATEEALIYGILQLRDMLAMSHRTIGGHLDPKIAQVKIDIVKLLDIRVKGSVAQVTKNLNVNVEAGKAKKAEESPAIEPPIKELPRMEDIDARLKELESEAIIGSSIPSVKPEGMDDVESGDPSKA